MTFGKIALRGILPVLLALSVAAAAHADERSVRRGYNVFKEKAQCEFCHNWDGGGQTSEYGGVAPSLRATQLDRDQIAEVVRCGRPGTNMPYHDQRAYTDDRCYGMTAEDIGDQIPNRGAVTLQRPQIDQLADYVAEVVKNRGPVTFEECEAYFGGASSVCQPYPKANAALEAPAGDKPAQAAAAATPRTPGG